MMLAAEITMQAMIAENKQREKKGALAMAYGEYQFLALLKEYRLNHNALLECIVRRHYARRQLDEKIISVTSSIITVRVLNGRNS